MDPREHSLWLGIIPLDETTLSLISWVFDWCAVEPIEVILRKRSGGSHKYAIAYVATGYELELVVRAKLRWRNGMHCLMKRQLWIGSHS